MDGLITSWNRGAEHIYGYKVKEVIGKSITILIPPNQPDEMPQILERLKKGERVEHYETKRRCKNRKIIDVSLTISPIKDKKGKVVGAATIARDISKRKQAEVVLSDMQESKRVGELFRNVVESAPNAMVLVDKTGKISLVNNQVEKLFGYERSELLGQLVEVLIPGRFKQEHPGLRTGFFHRPTARSMGAGRDLFARRKDGKEIPVEIGLNPIETPEGPMVLAAIIDITERKRAEERFRNVVESAPNAMVLVDKTGKISLVNNQVEKLFGYERSELLGQLVEVLIPGRFKQEHPGLRAGFFHHPTTRSMGAGRDLFARRKDGQEIPVEIGLNPIETPEGPMVLAAIIDITERKKALEREKDLQSQLVQVAKLSAIGELSAGVAHELNSPLAGLLSLIRTYKKQAPKDSQTYEDFQDMLEASEHMAKVISDLNTFARQSKSEWVDLSLEEMIESTLSFSAGQLTQRGIKLRKEYLPTPKIKGDKNQLQQVVLNMLTNARDAMSTGGELLIRVRQEKQNSRVVMSFADTGEGISSENLSRIFDPFFTTKGPGKGTGLGLSVSRGIVEQHGGQIFVESEEGKGSKFIISFPYKNE